MRRLAVCVGFMNEAYRRQIDRLDQQRIPDFLLFILIQKLL